jgi:hypothetical protein
MPKVKKRSASATNMRGRKKRKITSKSVVKKKSKRKTKVNKRLRYVKPMLTYATVPHSHSMRTEERPVPKFSVGRTDASDRAIATAHLYGDSVARKRKVLDAVKKISRKSVATVDHGLQLMRTRGIEATAKVLDVIEQPAVKRIATAVAPETATALYGVLDPVHDFINYSAGGPATKVVSSVRENGKRLKMIQNEYNDYLLEKDPEPSNVVVRALNELDRTSKQAIEWIEQNLGFTPANKPLAIESSKKDN